MNLKECRILVTPTSYGKNDARLKSELEALVGEVIYNPTGKPLSSAEVADLLPGVDGYIAGLDTIDTAALQSADKLKVIARYGVGYDKVDLMAAKAKDKHSLCRRLRMHQYLIAVERLRHCCPRFAALELVARLLKVPARK